jgi:predicted dienelactone hydrolase
MKPWKLLVVWLILLSPAGMPVRAGESGEAGVTPEVLLLVDPVRNRSVPVAIYQKAAPPRSAKRKLAIISHGYGGKNTDYGFIASYLATHGYFVASIQHEVPGDEPLPKAGNLYETRKPSWERGVQNILFVLGEMKKAHSDLDYGQLLLVGHSHGGDTSMLFAQEHPALVQTVITLDNRRMPFPRTSKPRLYSLRSSDQEADEGVVPSPEEQAKFGMKVVKLPATIHNDMWDGATAEQKKEIIHYLEEFLREEKAGVSPKPRSSD